MTIFIQDDHIEEDLESNMSLDEDNDSFDEEIESKINSSKKNRSVNAYLNKSIPRKSRKDNMISLTGSESDTNSSEQTSDAKCSDTDIDYAHIDIENKVCVTSSKKREFTKDKVIRFSDNESDTSSNYCEGIDQSPETLKIFEMNAEYLSQKFQLGILISEIEKRIKGIEKQINLSKVSSKKNAKKIKDKIKKITKNMEEEGVEKVEEFIQCKIDEIVKDQSKLKLLKNNIAHSEAV